jgi:hypothetical protein
MIRIEIDGSQMGYEIETAGRVERFSERGIAFA